MENRPLQVVACLIALLGLLPVSGQAAESAADEVQRAEWAKRLEHGKELQKQGGSKKREAKEKFATGKKDCFRKFQVTDCQIEVKQEYLKAVNEARRVENEGQAIERQVKKEQLADRDMRQAAREPDRTANRQAREEETRREREKAGQDRQAKEADQARKAAEGSRRRQADAERVNAKREKHARKMAEKMEKARRREAEAAE